MLESRTASTTFGGYHYAQHITTAAGAGIYGTIWGAMFSANTRDVTHVGHEVAEWLNDPFYPASVNVVPTWKHPISGGCSSQLEVGDPVATNFLPLINGYKFEDAVFLSWFSQTVPSTGIGGGYDLGGLFKAPAALCT